MTRRVPALGLLLAALVAGLSFVPTFGLAPLAVPLLGVLVAVAAVDELVLRRAALENARAVLTLLAGAVLTLLLVPLPALPGAASFAAVTRGAASGWIRTLESTFPARDTPETVTFVPLLVLVAAVLSVEWLRRGVPVLSSLVPSLVVVGVAQLYAAPSLTLSLALVAGFGVAAILVLVDGWGAGQRSRTSWGMRVRAVLVLAMPAALVAMVAGAAFAAADLLDVPTYSLHDRYELPTVPAVASNPLGEIGGRLRSGDRELFTVHTTADVDRWPVVALDAFDGANWRASTALRPLGAALPPDASTTVPTATATADVTLSGWAGPWLPTQFRTLSVDGVSPAVDPVSSALVADHPAPGLRYTVSWRQPQVDPATLTAAAIDPGAAGATRIDQVPQGVLDLARAGHERQPALVPDRSAARAVDAVGLQRSPPAPTCRRATARPSCSTSSSRASAARASSSRPPTSSSPAPSASRPGSSSGSRTRAPMPRATA